MKVTKVMNNSLILAIDNNSEEVIVMGKGIGFHHKVGQEIEQSKIEKIFTLKDNTLKKQYIQLIDETPYEHIEKTNYIIEYAKKEMGDKLNDNIFITLVGHISYAIERYKKNIKIQNRLLWEIKTFYSQEYKIGKYAVDYLNKELNINLGEEEAGNIAFHFANAKTTHGEMENTMLSLKVLKDIFNIIQFNFSIKLDEGSLSHTRLITHLELFIQRILDGQMLESKENFIFQQMKKQYVKEANVISKIDEYIKKTLDIQITEEESLFLMIHIVRIARNS